MSAADEIVVIVDEHNNVVGAAPRREMRAQRLPHRSTYILVFNSQGALYVQKRTMTKDVFPGYYDPAAGGVVLAGESYEESAQRELYEEMGIRDVPLTPLFTFYFADERTRVWGKVFSVCIRWRAGLAARRSRERRIPARRRDSPAGTNGTVYA